MYRKKPPLYNLSWLHSCNTCVTILLMPLFLVQPPDAKWLHHCHCFLSATAFIAPVVVIDTAGSATVGERFTLTCRVTVVENVTLQPNIEWLVPGGSAVMSGVNNVTIGNVIRTGNRSFTLDLNFISLRISHGGLYFCSSSIGLIGRDGRSSYFVNAIREL